MVRIPHIKIPSVRVGGIDPTSDIGTAIGGIQPAPITYLTQWKIVGNSEVHTLPYPDGIVLPNGYKRCEYIETRGAGYINLGYNNLYSYEVKAVAQSINNTNGILIHNGEAGAQYFGCSKDGYWTIGGTTGISDVISTEPTIINLSFTNNRVEFTINGVSISRQGTSVTKNFYLFSSIVDMYPINGKVWYLKAFDGDTLVHHWIPCLDTNDVPCMYDVVIKRPYYNAGAGTFYYKLYPQPTEIWSCGDLGQDGKYHVKISNGVTVYDIPLDAPLRKVNDVADTIEFPSGTEGKALLTTRVEESGGELSPLDTPTTELVDAPQIEEAESYTCVISQGGKAVEWSSFTTESDGE